MTDSIKATLTDSMKAAMRAQDKERLGTIRLMLAALKQREVDERIVLTDEQIISILDKMIKQRRESIAQFEANNRAEAAAVEKAEIVVIQDFLPAQLSAEELEGLIKSAITESGATTARDMGKVMNILRPKLQGRADMTAVSGKVKESLS